MEQVFSSLADVSSVQTSRCLLLSANPFNWNGCTWTQLWFHFTRTACHMLFLFGDQILEFSFALHISWNNPFVAFRRLDYRVFSVMLHDEHFARLLIFVNSDKRGVEYLGMEYLRAQYKIISENTPIYDTLCAMQTQMSRRL